jgi:hypothetical protein
MNNNSLDYLIGLSSPSSLMATMGSIEVRPGTLDGDHGFRCALGDRFEAAEVDPFFSSAGDRGPPSACLRRLARLNHFVIDTMVGIDNLLDKDEGDLDALVEDLLQLAMSYDGAMTDAKLALVQDRFERWHGDAGSAIREGYSDRLIRPVCAPPPAVLRPVLVPRRSSGIPCRRSKQRRRVQ